MDSLNLTLGWLFVAIALLFTLGFSERLAALLYPQTPPLGHRIAAPLIFAALSMASFSGAALLALGTIVAVGGGLVAYTRRPQPRLRQGNH